MTEPAAFPLFQRPVTELPGIGPKRAELFAKRGVRTLYDLLTFFPRDLRTWQRAASLRDLEDGEDCLVAARVARVPSLLRKGRLTVLRTVLRDEDGAAEAVWFNQPYLKDRLHKDAWYLFRGTARRRGPKTELHNPVFEPMDSEADPAAFCQPVYPLTAGLTQGHIRTAVADVLDLLEGQLPEPLPAWVRREHRLCTVAYAYRKIHQPESEETFTIARRRLAFEEMFLVQAGLRMVKGRMRSMSTGRPLPRTGPVRRELTRMEQSLPFQLTAAQRRAVAEIGADMEQSWPMNRLLQGDVGSGKTVVAAMALYQAALNGCQGAVMAPTAILAAQHARTLQSLLSGCPGVRVALLTGATPAAERTQLLRNLADGELTVLVGTHALLEEPVRFHRLGLAVTDEQHRFGVRQRTGLAGEDDGSVRPHVLVMSATPIPRSLALMLYGDLDLSVMDERPPGRTPIETYAAGSADLERVYRLIRRQVERGRQVYVVCPMIRDAEEAPENGPPPASVEGTFRHFSENVFPDLSVGLLHGDLPPAEKEQIMGRFHEGRISVLVSTTVIEVGVDNPNATLLILYNAERFGLAQMHQLRGRIGRGEHRSVCVLLSDSTDATARERIRTLCTSDDGFEIAEKDLKLRGPGDFFGTRQHGIPAFRIANLYEDAALLREVSGCLDRVMQADPDLALRDHRQLLPAIRLHFADVFPSIGI